MTLKPPLGVNFPDSQLSRVEVIFEAPINVQFPEYGAKGDGSTDDTAAFEAALAVPLTGAPLDGSQGPEVFVPPGQYRVRDLGLPGRFATLRGAGYASTLKAAAGAAHVLRLDGLQRVKVCDLRVDGVDRSAVSGVFMGAAGTDVSEQNVFERVNFTNCLVGLDIGPGSPGYEQVDKNLYVGCWFAANTTDVRVDSVNGQEQTFVACDFWNGLPYSSAVGINLVNGSVNLIGGQFQTPGRRAVVFSGNTIEFFLATDTIWEGCEIDIDGSAKWPTNHVNLKNCILQGTQQTVKMGVGSSILSAEHCRFNTGTIDATASDCAFFDQFCTFNLGAAWNPTGSNPRHLQWTRNGLTLNRGNVTLTPLQTDQTALTVKRLSGQTAALIKTQDDAGTDMLSLMPNGAMKFTTQAASGIGNSQLFMDSADGKLKFKDGSGNVQALY